MCKRILFSVAVSLFLVFPVSAYQSPGSPAGFVNDFSGILSADAKARLEEKLTGFAAQESNEISVVTISSLDGDTIENYAVNLFAEWQIGRAKQDNGVLLLVAPNEREVRIEVGYGLEGALTDAESKMIIERVLIPAFKSEDYDGGISQAVESIMTATKGEYIPPVGTSQSSSKGGFYVGTFLFFFVIEAIIYFIRRAAKSPAVWPGALTGGLIGIIIGLVISAGTMVVGFLLGGALLGLGIDYVLSHTKAGEGMRRGGRGGGFFMGGPGGGGGGFGGFGGGPSGGGGASGRW